METITYSIKKDKKNSEEYYKDVHVFTNEFLSHAENSLKPIALDFIDYLRTYKLEEIREIEEYILELLSFGILWRSYANKALKVKRAPFITLARMSEWRKKHQQVKPIIDFIRGIFFTFFLLPTVNNKKMPPIPKLEQIDHVCKWFEATGEFREQALRFIRWRAFWGTLYFEDLIKYFYTIEEFTNWFEVRSKDVLGKYTENVESFLRRSKKSYRWREDRISCTRTRLEYHLNMVGAELLNRAFRSEYSDAKTKVVLVPGCMRGRPADKCEAKKVTEGLQCEGCLSSCHVNQLREMGKKHDFEVYIIPHASDLSLWGPSKDRPARGVVASACVTTLVEGGWELKRYDVPAQCVLLDYCGCKKHWHHEGITTELNIRELKRILFN
jgi:hypothetical protein